MEKQFSPGDRVVFHAGKYKGRTGVFKRYGSSVFPEKCRVLIDLKGRQRVQETIFADWADLSFDQQQPTVTPKKTTVTDLATILISSIVADPNQPRKFYDETAMQELTASIREKGVLQPILLRPSGSGYMIVCGERRYRAAQLAGLNQIPAVIREVSDDEALALQIIENLQRKDVQPMEEAVAFDSLRKKYSIEEIAARVGKPATFVAKRLQLNSLLPQWQELLHYDRIKLTDAYRLAMLDNESQDSILKECRMPSDWKQKDWTPGWLDSYLDRKEQNLDKATFQTEDIALYPEMGACGSCRFNSHAALLIQEGSRICSNPSCFAIKTQRAFKRNIDAACQDPGVVLVCAVGYLGSDDKKKLAAIQAEATAPILMEDQFEIIQKPEAPQKWEEYLQEQYDPEDYETEEEREEAIADHSTYWQQEVKDYQEELEEYNKAIASGKIRKAFVVMGGWQAKEGTYIDIIIKAAKKGSAIAAPAGTTSTPASAQQQAEILQLEQELAGIEQREARAKELDREKVYKQILDKAKAKDSVLLTSGSELFPEEWSAVIMAMVEVSIPVRNVVSEATGAKNGYYGTDLYKALVKNGTNEMVCKALRAFFLDKLVDNYSLDPHKSGKAAAMADVFRRQFGPEFKEAELQQEEKAIKRGNNVAARIRELEAKIEALKASAPKPISKTKKATA